MSADLFAEFSQPSKPSSQPAQQQQQQQQSSAFGSLGNSSAQAKDPFDFGYGGTNNSSATSPSTAPQWPAFQPQQPSTGGGGFASSPAMSLQPAQTSAADDDDGWGDFEVADAPAPKSSAHIAPQEPSWSSAFPVSQAATQESPWQGSAFSSAPQGIQQESSWQSTGFPAASQGISPAAGGSSSTFDMMDSGSFGAPSRQFQEGSDISWPQPEKKKPAKLRVQSQAADPDVLFDAGDFELENGEFEGEEEDEDGDEDEFGDFETVRSPPAASPAQSKAKPSPAPAPASVPTYTQPPSMDLLSLDDTPQPAQQPPPLSAQSQPLAPPRQSGALSFGASRPAKPANNTSPWDDSDDLFGFGQPTTKEKPKATSPAKKPSSHQKKTSTAKSTANAWAAESQDDEWAAWDDVPSNSASKGGIDQAPPPSNWDWGAEDASQSMPSNDNDPPPVNVPPPSIILSTFPELLGSGSALFKSTTGQSGTIKEQILSNPKAVQFLQGYILLATTAARVIAGRKHRWHRDKILAKSMSISAAGSKGMKLAGVDKTQAAREGREAADVVAVWREHVGRLRSAVAVANTAGKTNLKVPELSETLPVHTAKNVPTAAKPCVVCGLKRDERINKVDFDVEDSFGEWWVEHWGHRACKNFWVEHEQHLRQR
ncbi:hypothetical protein K4F52_000250 [Lecanicillium sp. MT-2017a]|nr:hypothetical protein K4F52_000250 [Lecanicillium sp. MT-2017a]